MADTRAIVQYSYRAKRDDEIDLAIGEVVQVFAKGEDGRCKGVIGNREGWFPGNCTGKSILLLLHSCITFRFKVFTQKIAIPL